jgi:hypothetical protein
VFVHKGFVLVRKMQIEIPLNNMQILIKDITDG